MKGICFIEPMFNKVPTLEKLQTRRIITPQPDGRGFRTTNIMFEDWHGREIRPKYKVGETVYLKEPYAETCDEYGTPIIAYKFGGKPRLKLPDSLGCEMDTDWCIDNYPACGEWKNKLFMPQWAARYFIEITAVRAERLQDISKDDCLKEGIISRVTADYPYELIYQIPEIPNYYATARRAYASLINRINGKGTWERNPFVWVYDFKFIK